MTDTRNQTEVRAGRFSKEQVREENERFSSFEASIQRRTG